MVRSISLIKSLVSRGEASVLTAQEVLEMVENKESIALEDVDVVTTATRAVMSGTYAVLSFPVASTHPFRRAKRVWLEGIPAHVGPCPNERLGVLDLMIFGTDHSRDNPTYGGGHLLRELLEGKKMTVLVETDSGKTLETEAGLDEIPFARLYGTRQCFKNYAAFVNSGDEPISSIFNAIAFEPKFGGATVSGCGHLNPLKNDPLMETIGVGTRVLINGAEGFVTGKGTRSTEERPNLSGFADMHQMDPQYMGGFMTSSGPECIVSWAVPIPVLNASVLKSISVADRDIPLPVVDVVNRVPIGETTYGDVWEGTDLVVSFDPKLCLSCSRCRPEESCPTGAISFEKGVPKLDWRRCFNCGLCASACVGGTFKANLGTLSFDKREVPIILRQSDRMRAQKLAEDLKERILDGRFQLSEMSERIY